VVGAGGAIRVREPASSWTQRLRLEGEGVGFSARGRVRMAEFRWAPGRGRSRREPR